MLSLQQKVWGLWFGVAIFVGFKKMFEMQIEEVFSPASWYNCLTNNQLKKLW